MRKALLITALALLVAFAAYATESDPSNTVGFIKWQKDGHGFLQVGFTPFSLPFDYYEVGYIPTDTISAIIGTQGTDYDEIWSQTRLGSSSIFYGGAWFNVGVFPLYNTDAYWYYHWYTTDTVNVTTAGEVHSADILYGSIPLGFFKCGVPIAEPTWTSQLDLDDITPDPIYLEVWDQVTYISTFWYSGYGWQPDMLIYPGYPIWVVNESIVGPPNPTGPWTYRPGDDGRDVPSSGVRVSPITPEQRIANRATAPSNTRNAPTPDRRVR